jgi:hypothetical protein
MSGLVPAMADKLFVPWSLPNETTLDVETFPSA